MAETKQTGGQTIGFPLLSGFFGQAAQLPSAIPGMAPIFTDMLFA